MRFNMNRIIIISFLFVIMATNVPVFAGGKTIPQIIGEAKSQITEVTVEEIKNDINAGKNFVLLDTSFHFQSLAVIEASESREMVRLNIEYEKLQQTCDECHEKYKKKK